MDETNNITRSAPLRLFWFALGWVCVGLGGIGLLLPVMPSTIFFICAATCFARSSPRFLAWLLALPTIGPLVRDWRAGLGMPKRAKIIAVSMLFVMAGGSALMAPWWQAKLAVAGLALLGIWYIVWRVPMRQ
jgi:hypothetical protein